jgi:hypothetical protein
VGQGEARVWLVVAARPFQVNPPSQFLNIAGGAARIRTLRRSGDELVVNGSRRLRVSLAPRAVGMLAFDEGDFVGRLSTLSLPERDSLTDATGRASAALQWSIEFTGPGHGEVDVRVPLRDVNVSAPAFTFADADRWQQEEEERWEASLGAPILAEAHAGARTSRPRSAPSSPTSS